jgi:hypothetical protein
LRSRTMPRLDEFRSKGRNQKSPEHFGPTLIG